jgi:biopolymer transport protein ExbB
VRKLTYLFLLLIPAVSQAWWNDDWNYRKEITFDLTPTGANVAGTPLDVPVLVRLSLANFGYFADTKPDGSDFRFIEGDDKTPLKFHIERYDATNQLAFLWVRVPKLTGASKTDKIYLYYGNPKAPAASDAAGTYDVNQALAIHFGDPSQPVSDVTGYANHPTASTAELTSASLIAGGAKFSGSQSIVLPANSSLRLIPAKGGTLSAWVRIDAAQGDAYVLALQDQGNEWILGIRGSQVYSRVVGGTARAEILAPASLTTGQWHHLAATVGSGKLTLYVDGDVAGTANVQPPEIAGSLTVGAGAAAGHNLSGEVDEVQGSSVARSADWLRAAAKSQGQDTALIVYGGDAQRETQKVSYFRVTLQNVTADGWVVIILLMAMLVVALLVMVSKAFYLARVQRANAAFLSKYEKLQGDSAALDRPDEDGDEALDQSGFMPSMEGKGDDFRFSTIYRLYHHGVKEMTGRVKSSDKNGTQKNSQSLSPQAIDAIRATMDATLVRLTQKLQANMVLLTIAIAGGPFLGLLGTVVGVMITFAAIAASGDVNVNSIAPGIAAALVATVAGLGVAIPSLFGYNWLNTKIRETNANMRVFVDEFVARVAEQYS